MSNEHVFAGSGVPALEAVAFAGAFMAAGGFLGAAAGLVTGGLACLDLHDAGELTAGKAALVLGRDISVGLAAGAASAAAMVYVGAAALAVGAVVSAPLWIPTGVAVVSAGAFGFLVAETGNRIWTHCTGPRPTISVRAAEATA